ncbi:g-protein coupled receptor 98 [Trichonephila clavipes]|nr:g-protein coupled receptor 98 [Trichonephila clavipes]
MRTIPIKVNQSCTCYTTMIGWESGDTKERVASLHEYTDPELCVRASCVVFHSLSVSPGVFEFRESEMKVRESLRKAILTIKRTGGTDGPVSLRLRTVDGTAIQTQDYKPLSKVIHFNPGEQEKTCEIDIIDDDIPEGVKQFRVGLFDPTHGAVLGPNSIANIVIMDDDSKYEFISNFRL